MVADKEQMIWIPIPLPSIANLREHWAKRAARAAEQRGVTRIMLCGSMRRPSLPVEVVLTRVSPRKLDTDNLWAAFKAVRDGVADWLELDDGDERVTWYCKQLRSHRRRAIQITVRSHDA